MTFASIAEAGMVWPLLVFKSVICRVRDSMSALACIAKLMGSYSPGAATIEMVSDIWPGIELLSGKILLFVMGFTS